MLSEASVCRSRELRRKMTAPDGWGLLARQRAFALVAQRLLVTRRLPSALVLFDCGNSTWGSGRGGAGGAACFGRDSAGGVEGVSRFREGWVVGGEAGLCGEGAGGGRGEGEGGESVLACDVVRGLRLNGYTVALEEAETMEEEVGGARQWDVVVVVQVAQGASCRGIGGGREGGVGEGEGGGASASARASVVECFQGLRDKVGRALVVWWADEGVGAQGVGGGGGGCAAVAAAPRGTVDVCVSSLSHVEAWLQLEGAEGEGEEEREPQVF